MTPKEEQEFVNQLYAKMNAPLTPEQEQLYTQAYVLEGDERIAFMRANGIDFAKFGQFVERFGKAKRGRRKHRRKLKALLQGGACPLCDETLITGKTKLDRVTEKLLCNRCQLLIGHVRAAVRNGITLDRLTKYLAPPLDPFDPQSPDL